MAALIGCPNSRGWVTEKSYPSLPYSMADNGNITPEVWGGLFAVPPDTQISNLK